MMFIYGTGVTYCTLRLVVVRVSNFSSSKGEKVLERSMPSVGGFNLLNGSLYGTVSQ